MEYLKIFIQQLQFMVITQNEVTSEYIQSVNIKCKASLRLRKKYNEMF